MGPSTDDPFWWGDGELQLLQGTRLHKAAAHYSAGLEQLHSWLHRLEQLRCHQQPGAGGTLATADGGWGLTRAAVRWARSAVWSRAFTIRGLATSGASSSSSSNSSGSSAGAQTPVVALVPVLDMCDHHPEQRMAWRVVSAPEMMQEQRPQQVFQFTTLKPVAKVGRLGLQRALAATLGCCVSPLLRCSFATSPPPSHACSGWSVGCLPCCTPGL
jgi:hypothetical protein